jgi:hypothetical protein
MSEALIKRLDEVHRGTLVLVQRFSQEDFNRKAPAAEWSVKDLFAHLTLWNREALAALESTAGEAPLNPAPPCRGIPAGGGAPTLRKVMEEFRNSEHALVGHIGRGKRRDAERIARYVEDVIRHYQSHQNDLRIFVNSLRPH